MATPVLQIRVLGPFEVSLGDEGAPTFESLKARALLAYLAVESGRPHSREAVASMLWPERPDSAALANLRHTLASLRTSLGERFVQPGEMAQPLFNVTSNTIQISQTPGVWVDLNAFEQRLAAAGLEPEADQRARIDPLSAAVQLYRGRFLEGFSLKGCPEFEDWMLLRRESAALKLQKALRNLADAHESGGEWEQALAALRQLLQLEPWDESAHRKMMALLAAHYQRSAALSQFERCRKLLWDELGVEPEEETLRLYEQIRAGKFTGSEMREPAGRRARGSGALRAASLAEQKSIHRFAGRTTELARLHQALKLALANQGQLLFITGEAGSGKTRLAAEFAQQALAQHGDLIVASGRCNAITGLEDPYLPFREILQMLVSGNEMQPGASLRPEHLRRLTEAFPEIIKALMSGGQELIDSFILRDVLRQRVETFSPGGYAWQREFTQLLEKQVPVTLPATSSAQRRTPNEPVVRMLSELARHRPLVLFLDDLQWADVGSVSLLHYLCKRLAGSRMLVVGAYRPQDIALGRREPGIAGERHPLDPVRLELQRVFGEIELNLDRSPGLAFVEALINGEPNCLGDEFRQTLYHHTDGNALFTLELLRDMQERGFLVQDQSGRWVEARPLDWEKLPARVEAVIAERIGRLPPAQQELLQAASVEGEVFTGEVAARVLGLEESQVAGWLSGMLGQEQQIVGAVSLRRAPPPESGQPVGLSRYRFTHILFQKYLYSRLDPVVRSRLHEATGNALERLYGPATLEDALQLAWHFEQAGLIAKAVGNLLAAGKHMITLSAHVQASALYDRCLGLIQRLPESPERIRLEIQAQLAREGALLVTEGWGSPKAVQAASRVAELSQQAGASSADPSMLMALYFQADHFTAQNNMPAALERVDLLQRQVSTQTERVYRLLADQMAGQVYLFAGQPAAAVEYLEHALAIYTPQDQPRLIELVGYKPKVLILTWLAFAQWILGFPGRARGLSQQAIALARQESSPFDLASSLAITGAEFYAIQDEPEIAMAYARECLEAAGAEDFNLGRILGETVLGWAQVKLGEHEAGLRLIRRGIEAWKAAGAQTLPPINLLLLADALSLAGQTDAGLELIASVRELVEQSGRRMFEAHLEWLQGEILRREQDHSGPAWKPAISPPACFERAISVACQQQARSLELRATLSLAQVMKAEGQPADAARRLQAIYSQFKEGVETDELHRARQLLAELRLSG